MQKTEEEQKMPKEQALPSDQQGKIVLSGQEETSQKSEVIDVDKLEEDLPPHRITRKLAQKPCICPPSEEKLSVG